MKLLTSEMSFKNKKKRPISISNRYFVKLVRKNVSKVSKNVVSGLKDSLLKEHLTYALEADFQNAESHSLMSYSLHQLCLIIILGKYARVRL